jgi:ArsR family transcriptional regulator
MGKLITPLTQASACAAKLKVLADPTRLAVMEALMNGPMQVGALQLRLGVEQSLLSHHLQTLRKAGLVHTERDGKAVLYRLAEIAVARAGGSAIDLGCCLLSFD